MKVLPEGNGRLHGFLFLEGVDFNLLIIGFIERRDKIINKITAEVFKFAYT